MGRSICRKVLSQYYIIVIYTATAVPDLDGSVTRPAHNDAGVQGDRIDIGGVPGERGSQRRALHTSCRWRNQRKESRSNDKQDTRVWRRHACLRRCSCVWFTACSDATAGPANWVLVSVPPYSSAQWARACLDGCNASAAETCGRTMPTRCSRGRRGRGGEEATPPG